MNIFKGETAYSVLRGSTIEDIDGVLHLVWCNNVIDMIGATLIIHQQNGNKALLSCNSKSMALACDKFNNLALIQCYSEG